MSADLKPKRVSHYIPEPPSVDYLLDLLPPPPKYPTSGAVIITALTGGSGSAMYQRWLRDALCVDETDLLDEHEDRMLRAWREEVEFRVEVFRACSNSAMETGRVDEAEEIFFGAFPGLERK